MWLVIDAAWNYDNYQIFLFYLYFFFFGVKIFDLYLYFDVYLEIFC